MNQRLTPAHSILIGSVIIGAGLFFGLRDRGAPSPGVLAAPGPVIAVAPVEGGVPGAVPVPAAVQPGTPSPMSPMQSAAASAKATAQATKALEDARPELVRKCWAPAIAKNPKPATSKYVYSLSFDPEGKQIARGIMERRGDDSRSDVGECLRALPLDLRIPPPGVHVSVEAPLTLP